MNKLGLVSKRTFDIFFSAIGLLLLLPLFVITAILIKLDSHGFVFFAQKRIGKNFIPFNLYKFRTMTADAPRKGLLITAGNDPRVTRIGRILRKTKMDELPQLWNVFKGDMSLVGPRPEVRKYVSRYRGDYKEILTVRPGITDAASLTYSNEEDILRDKKDPEEYYVHVLLPEKIKLSKEYVKKVSILYDTRLILFTIFKLIYPRRAINRIIDVATPYRRPLVISIQLLVFGVANYIAFFIRFDGKIPSTEFDLFVKYLPLIMVLRVIFMFSFSLDRGIWKYVSIGELLNVIFAVSSGSLLFFLSVRYFEGEFAYPRSVFVIDWFINVFCLGGIRLFHRLHERSNPGQTTKKRVIVIGAGDAAEMLIRDIEYNSAYPYRIIGLIDDDPRKRGLRIRNVPILGTRKELTKIVEKAEPEKFLIAIPSASPAKLQTIVKDLREFGLPIKMLPGLREILRGKSSLDKIKAIDPEDVLFRSPVRSGHEKLRHLLNGKKVMITGAGGSIGAELSRQIAYYKPQSLVLFERHEESLYELNMELRNGFETEDIASAHMIHSVIGDILDRQRVVEVIEKFRPDMIFHAAAYKHVPLMESNPYEAFKVNVIGTKFVADTARKYGVKRFILISTDKAVNPENFMGMSKKIAENVVRYLSLEADDTMRTKYITVRFGNVLDSSGSVVPLFKKQIAAGGPVTVTHPDITRYFMTIPEAVDLMLHAAVLGEGGELFVLDMGRPIKILDLAKRMINLYGYRPGIDVELTFIGLRPGEKLYEELFNSDEKVEKTSHPKINKAVSNSKVNYNILDMIESVNSPDFFRDKADIKNIIKKLTSQPLSQIGEPNNVFRVRDWNEY